MREENAMQAVSVIVPVYGVEAYLDRCMRSLLDQTLKEMEIILVDDGSPDRCPEMCDEYRRRYGDRIKVIHKENGGLSSARNRGLEAACGEYIAFLDSDDYVEPEMYETMYRIASETDSDLVRVDHIRETQDGTVLDPDARPPMREGLYEQEEIRSVLLFPQYGRLPEENKAQFTPCSVWRNLYRHSIIRQYGITFISERLIGSEDMPFNFDFMMRCQRAYALHRKFYHYVVNDGSLTKQYRPGGFERELRLYHTLEERMKNAGVYDVCELRLRRHLLDRLRRCVKGELCGNPQPSAGRENARKMMNAPEVLEVLADYPLERMPLKYRAVYTLIKYRCVRVLYRLREKL